MSTKNAKSDNLAASDSLGTSNPLCATNTVDAVKHDPSAKPADFTIISHPAIFGLNLQ